MESDANLIMNIFIMFMLVVTSLAVAFSRNLLSSTIFFTIFSLLMALMYVILNAPDVAITEAAIGAGISSILFLAAILLTGEKEKPKKFSIFSYAIFVFTGIVLAYSAMHLPKWGDISSPASTHLSPYFINESYNDIGIPNVVTSILASYRGFDTLGEVFVVFTALIAVFVLLYGRITKEAP